MEGIFYATVTAVDIASLSTFSAVCTLFADNNFVIMCIVVHSLHLIIVSKLLTTTYCGMVYLIIA